MDKEKQPCKSCGVPVFVNKYYCHLTCPFKIKDKQEDNNEGK